MLKSYRARLLLAFLGAILASLALFAALTLTQFVNYSRQTRLEELHLRLKLTSTWVEPLAPQTKDALHNVSADWGAALFLIYGDATRARFYATDGYAIPDADAGRIKGILDRELVQPRAAQFDSGDLVIVTQPVITADQTPALLAAVLPAANLTAGWRRLLDAMLYAALFGVILSLLLALIFSRSLARPVTRLIAASERIAQGVYDDPPLPADANELGRLTRAFNAMRERVRQAQQQQRDFLTNVSHDLKTPLAIAQGYASALADGAADDEDSRQRAFAGIQRETERMTQLIAALLELARLEAGLTPFKFVALDMTTLARQVLTDLAPQAQAQELKLLDELPAALPAIPIDALQMERVLVNLLDNALRLTPRGGAIRVGGAVQAENQIALWVQDSGPGIAPTALPHIFDRFYQADAARSPQRAGSGLGLTIAREIVMRHGGELSVANESGHGARFTILLPSSRAGE
ncbi:MAG: HAMP domain-containing histidine kinase [Chloroflexi bacterium]|nr:HAMP domain-containing histidine kinase [Chloroflexota bacterium]